MKNSRQKISPKNGFLVSVTRKDNKSRESTSIIIESKEVADIYALRLLESGKYFSITLSPV
jgi:hypothetical protein